MKVMLLICSFFSLTTMAQQGITKDQYPRPHKSDQEDVLFGTAVKDPYRWMENDRSEETATWVKEENEVTDKYLSKIPYRNAIKERLTELWNYEKYSVPFKEGGYTYYYKNDGLQNQSVLYRQKPGGKPQVFLDPNKFSIDGTTSLSSTHFTKDGSLCGYMISEGGSDWGKIIVIDAATKERVGDTLQNIKFSNISWKGNEGFFYSTYDVPKDGSQLSAKTDQHKLYFHRLHTPQSEDILIFGGAQSPRRYVQAYVTEDQNFLIIQAAIATTGNELYFQDLTKKESTIVPIVTGFETTQSVVYASHGKLYILTNKNAPNNRLVVTDALTPSSEYWKDIIPETRFPLNVSTGANKFFASYVKDAVSQIVQYNLSGKKEKEVQLPGLGSARGFS